MTLMSDRNDIAKKLFELANKFGEIEVENVQIAVDELTLQLRPIIAGATRGIAALQAPAAKAVDSLLEAEFVKPVELYPGQVAEVHLGATASQGGTRSVFIKIGGTRVPPFYSFEGSNPNRPAFAMDVFDMPLTLPKVVRQHYEGVMDDPAAWAKKSVREFNADIISFNLISTDPGLKNTSAEDAAQTVRDVLKAVNVPVIIGGSGNKQKDPVVLERAAGAAHGERVLLN